jgi:diazepam-binding inhibitor (GABA receptor modulating acyl-CoA-binding protein)
MKTPHQVLCLVAVYMPETVRGHADFEAAANYVMKGPSLQASNKDKLNAYAFYKQATVGDCPSEPELLEHVNAFIMVKRKAMRDAWCNIKGTPKDEAKTKYVELIDQVNKYWRTVSL